MIFTPLVRQLDEDVAQHFHRALHIALEDDEQLLLASGLQLLGQTFQRNTRALRQLRFARSHFAVLGDAARLFAIRHGNQLIASLRQSFQAENLDRRGRSGALKGNAAIVEHRAHLAENVAHHEVVAGMQRAVLYQYGRHRTATAIQLGFQHGATCQTLR